MGNVIVSIYDVALDKTVWKAKIHLQASGIMGVVTGDQLDDFISKVIDAMTTDGLLLAPANK